MSQRPSSSGDLLADRRFAYARAMIDAGDHAGAADLLVQTLERVPAWTPAWMALGEAEERRGNREAAIEAYRRASSLDGAEAMGASLHVARLGADLPPAGMSAAYVAALFDDYAPRFDRHLTEALGYTGPALIGAAISAACGDRRFLTGLDLGCGTGLMGTVIAPRVEALDGVDLSPRMVERAKATGHYRSLRVADLLSHLDGLSDASYGLVLAADVFVYIGALELVAGSIARTLQPDGLLAFTTQRSDADLVRLGPDLRFAHSEAYLRSVLSGAGLVPLVLHEASTRHERDLPVPGLVVVARRA